MIRNIFLKFIKAVRKYFVVQQPKLALQICCFYFCAGLMATLAVTFLFFMQYSGPGLLGLCLGLIGTVSSMVFAFIKSDLLIASSAHLRKLLLQSILITFYGYLSTFVLVWLALILPSLLNVIILTLSSNNPVSFGMSHIIQTVMFPLVSFIYLLIVGLAFFGWIIFPFGILAGICIYYFLKGANKFS